MNREEFTIDQIRAFVAKGYNSVAARYVKAALCHIDRLSLPPAEGAEEILDEIDLGEPLQTGEFYYRSEVLEAMNKFATLHAQRIAEKMVKEKCKKCKYRGLPDSINEALNSGDGVYRP